MDKVFSVIIIIAKLGAIFAYSVVITYSALKAGLLYSCYIVFGLALLIAFFKEIYNDGAEHE